MGENGAEDSGSEKKTSYWSDRLKGGRPPAFETPDDLIEAIAGYFEWAEANPLQESKAFSGRNGIQKTDLPKMRAITIAGCCIHIGISQKSWSVYREKDGFSQVITRAEEIIRQYKFEGAAAELLNPNIIARDLGLKDQQEIDLSKAQPAMVVFGVRDASIPNPDRSDEEESD